MANPNSQLYADIEALSAIDKLMLVDWILRSLDKPDPEIDRVWSTEAEKRLDGYEKGQIKAVELDTVLQKYRKQ
ncbi:MAG: addiction module protein [Phormidium sp.]